MTKIRDMIVVLPGITGSVLEKEGKAVWAASVPALWRGLTTGLGSLGDLALAGVDDPDPQAEVLDDGIRATRLIDDVHIVPGLHKIDGYTGLRHLLTRQFQVVEGHLDRDHAANYFEFPYDWRRDNRVSARRLQQLIGIRLPRWRDFSGNPAAKTILIAHSMGGLISRYYLEVLGGWRDCKLLVTFGTPYRGSLNMVRNLVEGIKVGGFKLDALTAVMQSLPSAYQLLPRYPAIYANNQWLRVTETDVIPNLTPEMAQKGLSFMYEIDAARERNEQEADYRQHKYKIVPVVGTDQPTLQSARYEAGQVRLSYGAPPVVGDALSTGDGTVPRASAVPLELSDEYRESFHPEQHSALQSNRDLLSRLAATLATTQSRLGEVRGGDPVPEPDKAALALTVEDVVPAGQPVTLTTELRHRQAGGDLVLTVTGPSAQTVPIPADDGPQRIDLPLLAAGVYRVELAVVGGQATPVHDVFAVAEV